MTTVVTIAVITVRGIGIETVTDALVITVIETVETILDIMTVLIVTIDAVITVDNTIR